MYSATEPSGPVRAKRMRLKVSDPKENPPELNEIAELSAMPPYLRPPPRWGIWTLAQQYA
jgi:hypothetical protein